MSKQSLFSINAELEDIFLEIEENGGEVTEELLQKLAITEENLKTKLDGYRKAYSALMSDVEVCKKEKTRIDGIIKVRNNNAERLKNAMHEAVSAYGELGKSGNRVINLPDSKLYTKTSKACDINERYALVFKDLVIENLRELYNNDMLSDSINSDSIDPIGFIDVINATFEATYPELSVILLNEVGHLFTIDDLNALGLKMEIEFKAINILNKDKFSLVNAYFDNEHISNLSLNISKSNIKALIEANMDITFGEIKQNESLIIK